MTELDILIIGGGPAGLLYASRLGGNHRVGLVERDQLGRTTKYWVTTERRLTRHGLAHCMLHSTKEMLVGTFLGGHAAATGDFAVVDEHKLLLELLERCRSCGVLLVEGATLLNLSWLADGRVKAQTTGVTFVSRLVIDASGGSSPIARTFQLHDLRGFYTVYGAKLTNIDLHSPGIVLGYIGHLGNPPPILEVIPCGGNSAYCAVFTYSQQLSTPAALRATFSDNCRYNPFFEITNSTETVLPKMGTIAIGRPTGRFLPNILPIGEAALTQPPLLGTAFNEILEYAEPICLHVSRLLDSGDAIRAARYRYPFRKLVQDRIQLALAQVLLKRNVEAFDSMVRLMGKLGTDITFGLCSNELSWRQMMGLAAVLPSSAFAGWLSTISGPERP